MFKKFFRRNRANIVYPITDQVALQLEQDALRSTDADTKLTQLYWDRIQADLNAARIN